METQNIVNLLSNTENEYSKFATKNGISTIHMISIKSNKIFNKFIRIKSL